MILLIFSIITGVILILAGILVPNQPSLISGYSTMSKEKLGAESTKKSIRYTGWGFIIGGVILICGGSLTYFFKGNINVFIIVFLVSIFIPVINATIQLKRISNKDSKTPFTIIMVIFSIIAAFIVFSSWEAKVSKVNGQIKIGGLYGETVKMDDIERIELIDRMPEITIRMNGYSLGNVSKGYFGTKSKKTVKLFIHSGNRPYLCITKKTGQQIYLNSKRPDKTKEIYEKIIGIKQK